MTRKGYQAIADAIQKTIRFHPNGYAFILPQELISELSFHFSIDNPRFDVDRFQLACQPLVTMDEHFSKEQQEPERKTI